MSENGEPSSDSEMMHAVLSHDAVGVDLRTEGNVGSNSAEFFDIACEPCSDETVRGRSLVLDHLLGSFCVKCRSVSCVHRHEVKGGKHYVSSAEIASSILPVSTQTEGSGATKIRMATFNCLSLSPFKPSVWARRSDSYQSKHRYAGMDLTGRVTQPDHSFNCLGVHVVCIQERRLHSQFRNAKNHAYVMYSSSNGGRLGCEIWFNRKIKFRTQLGDFVFNEK